MDTNTFYESRRIHPKSHGAQQQHRPPKAALLPPVELGYMNAAWVNAAMSLTLEDQPISALERWVLVCLCKYIAAGTISCFPGRAELKQTTGLGEATVRRCIKKLEKKRVLRVIGRRIPGSKVRLKNIYVMRFVPLEKKK